MNRSYKIEGIVIGRHNLGEADKLVTLFTKQRGKKTVIAKGVRRIISKRAPYLELFVHCDLVLHQGRTFDVVTEVSPIHSFTFMRTKLERIGYVYSALELTGRLTAENQPSQAIYMSLLSFLDALNQPETDRSYARNALFTYKQFLLVHLGFEQQNVKVSEQVLDRRIENLIEATLKSKILLTNIQA